MKTRVKIDELQNQSKPHIKLLLAKPRGFCAGVARAVHIVEAALTKYGAPIYVRHEIVHNAHVVSELAAQGAVFVETLEEIPTEKQVNDKMPTKMPHVIFSAHGVAPEIIKQAKAKGFHVLDATCPLVSKVHAEVRRHQQAQRHIFLIGHRHHPEIIGTIGHIIEAGDDNYTLIETIQDAKHAQAQGATAYATQTTLSVSETAEIIAVLKQRFPDIVAPLREDICYATTNRQNVVAELAPQCDWFFILGAHNSSNAQRLVETATRFGAKIAKLINHAQDIPYDKIVSRETSKLQVIGLSAGASTPEFLVQEVIDSLRQNFNCDIHTITKAEENLVFKMPAELKDAAH